MMATGKRPQRPIWLAEDEKTVRIIDQRLLPFGFKTVDLKTPTDAFEAIKNMTVRGAPLIGVTGAFGIYLALLDCQEADWKIGMEASASYLKSARPTAVNLAILVDEMVSLLAGCQSLVDPEPQRPL